MEIDGKCVVVTGGAKGLGFAISTHLSALGASVAILDRDRTALETASKAIGNCLPIYCDVSQPQSVDKAVEQVMDNFNSLDVLINNAGIMKSSPLVNVSSKGDDRKHSQELWKDVIDVNLNGTFFMTRSVASAMLLKRTRGVIVNISSIAAQGNLGQTAYSAAKAGVEAMTVVWAKELGRFKVRCVAVAPGFMDTPGAKDALNESIHAELKQRVPLGRLGSAQEVAAVVEQIIANDFLNGCVISLDGGMRL